MFSKLFESVTGIEFFGLVSLFVFFSIFLVVLFWTLKIDKSYIAKMKKMPLDSSASNGDTKHD